MNKTNFIISTFYIINLYLLIKSNLIQNTSILILIIGFSFLLLYRYIYSQKRLVNLLDKNISTHFKNDNELIDFINKSLKNETNLDSNDEKILNNSFFSNVTHEFKTPIFTIKGLLETLENGAIDDKNINKTFVRKISKNVMRIESLIIDLIQLSQLSSNNYNLKLEEVKLNSIMEYVSEIFKEEAIKKDLTLSIPNVEGIKVLGNYDGLISIFSNLISNAIFYSDKGKITILAKKQLDKIHIKIIDNGIGIAEENHEKIFNRFYRVNPDRSRKTGGTGLGLAIVKHLVKAHNSEIIVNSIEDQGSEFSFTLELIN